MGKQRMQTNFHFIVISVNWFGITTITTRSMCLELGHQVDRDRGRPSEIKQSPRWKKIRHLFSLHQSLTDWQHQKGTLTVIDYKTCLDFSCSNNLPSITTLMISYPLYVDLYHTLLIHISRLLAKYPKKPNVFKSDGRVKFWSICTMSLHIFLWFIPKAVVWVFIKQCEK